MAQVKYYDTGSSQWLAAVNGGPGLQGVQGLQGLQGFGYAQLQGTQGTQGLQGLQGTQGIQGPINYTYSINSQTGTTFVPILSDNSSLVTLSNASAISVTIPTNASVSFPIGTQLNFVQISTGQVTISAVTPGTTTIVSTGATSSSPKLRVQSSSATAIKTQTDTWYVFGDIV